MNFYLDKGINIFFAYMNSNNWIQMWYIHSGHPKIWASDRTFQGSKRTGNAGNLDIAAEGVKIAWNVMLPARDKVYKLTRGHKES